jgi:release factor glutamine methyltransferase
VILRDLRRQLATRLAAAGLPESAFEADLLVAHALGRDRTALLLRAGESVAPALAQQVEVLLARRLAGEPVGRIRGEAWFFGRRFLLSPATLEPRADTESVVAAALAALDGRATPQVLDIGTGTGAIAITLAAERPDARVTATDLAPQALATAAANAAGVGVGDRLHLVATDLAAALCGPFDLVVSNPPYIPSADIPTLDPEVRLHDPHLALDGGPDGLAVYRAILADAPRLLAPGGIVVLELGFGQAPAVATLAAAAGFARAAPDRPDASGIPRAMTLRRA